MRYVIDGTIEVSNRKEQFKLLLGCIIGFVKKLPVEVFEGIVNLDDRADLVKDRLYIEYNLPPGTLDDD